MQSRFFEPQFFEEFLLVVRFEPGQFGLDVGADCHDLSALFACKASI